jgi:hypothetical protein
MNFKPVFLFLIIFFSAGTAYAYIDPGSGSMMLQMLAAAGIGALVFMGRIWRWIKSKFKGRHADKNDGE